MSSDMFVAMPWIRRGKRRLVCIWLAFPVITWLRAVQSKEIELLRLIFFLVRTEHEIVGVSEV